MGDRNRETRAWLPAGGVFVLVTCLFLFLSPGVLTAQDSCYYKTIKDDKPSVTELKFCLSVQERFYQQHRRSAKAARYLYRMGRLQAMLYQATGREKDLDAAIGAFRLLVENHPRDRLADDAQYALGELMIDGKKDSVGAYVEFLKVEVNHPQGDMVEKAQARLRELGKAIKSESKQVVSAEQEPKNQKTPMPDPARPADPPPSPGSAAVVGLRHWSTSSYTRVVVDLTGEVKFTSHLLRPDPELKKPPRLYLDLDGARLGQIGEKEINISGSHLRRARLGQFDPKTVRVVLDIEEITGYKAFVLHTPERLVIDVTGSPGPEQTVAAKDGRQAEAGQDSGTEGGLSQTPPSVHKSAYRIPRGAANEVAGPTLATQLGLGVRTVVIDPGHGGKDPGCDTCRKDLKEKDITLAVAKKLAVRLRKEGLTVILTRTKDVFLPLEERTAIANTRNADLFISIHVNAAEDRSLAGIESYFLNLATDERAIQVAARENAITTKSISDLQAILNDLMMNTKINESNRLAFQTQRQLVSVLREQYPKVRSLGVKQAPFYVLLGARMPAVLVEIGFGTNKDECRRLASDTYLDQVAGGISQGIAEYVRQTKSGG